MGPTFASSPEQCVKQLPLFRIGFGHLIYRIFGLIQVLCWLVMLPAAEGGDQADEGHSSVGAMIVGGVVMLAMIVSAYSLPLLAAINVSLATSRCLSNERGNNRDICLGPKTVR
jgi:hypothetical protein